MSKPKRVHTLESLMAMTEEVGDCVEWSAYFQSRTPMVFHSGKMESVRKLIRMFHNKPVYPNQYLGVTCNNWRCVKEKHIAQRVLTKHMQNMQKQSENSKALKVTKIRMGARKRPASKMTEDKVNMIRMDERSASKIAADYGVSRSLIQKIRANKLWVVMSDNPFAWMMR